ncbi:DUF3019 domain-containing protein [uncultured Shewanella sp.]|uniref:DUF3019 domain-containing protein n=1 Tax=uncultured Shewanella sp. TaxID=173975 RepID=UPI00345C3D6B
MCGEANAAKNKNLPILQLFPELCITSTRQLLCYLQVEIKCKLNIFKPTYILSSYHEIIQWCKSSPVSKLLTLNDRRIKVNIFKMIDKETNKTLVGTECKDSPTSMSHLRRLFRNAWSLF